MRLNTKNLALAGVFAALYSVFTVVPIFPILGASSGARIALASIAAPLIGLILGPFTGTLAVSIGGLLGWAFQPQSGAFSFLSFLPGAVSAFSSGLLFKRKRAPLFALYLSLFSILAFYPNVGPMWLYPYFLWFQLIGLLLLASPLTSAAMDFTHEKTKPWRLGLGVGIIFLVSILVGQIAGTVLYESMYVPTTGLWEMLTYTYPVERGLMALIATIIGTPVIEAVRAYGFEIGGIKKNATRSNPDQTSKAEQRLG